MWIIKFYWFDFDLDLMTLVLKLDLDIVKMYVCTKNEVGTFYGSKVTAWTDIQTDRQTDRLMDRQMNRHIDTEKDWTDIITYPHTWMVIKQECISVKCKPPACWQYGLHKIGRDIDIFLWPWCNLHLDV